MKGRLTTGRGKRSREKCENTERKNKIHRKENADANKARPEFVTAQIGVPGLLPRKLRFYLTFLCMRAPKIETQPKVPPGKRCGRQWLETKTLLQFPLVGAQIDAGFEHEMDREHGSDPTRHLTRPDADSGKEGERVL